MFQVNSYIVYGSNGVCKILEIGIPAIHGIDKSKRYYTLQPLYSNGSLIYTPVDNRNTVMREVISRKEALHLINDIPNIEIIQIPNDKLRDSLYKEILKKSDCRDLIKLIKTIYLKNQQRLTEGKKIGSFETKYLHDAEGCLFGELSIPLGISKDEMVEYITGKMDYQTMS